jgi:hypothetical protein
MTKLKLAALDQEDLEVLSAHMQDAVLRVADLVYLPKDKRFALVACRFAWERLMREGVPDKAANNPSFERRRTGLHFERVLKCSSRGIDRGAPDTILELLAIRFTETSAPAGTIDLLFAGGKDIRLEVECVEAAASDLGPAWATSCCPKHPSEAA